ncbi:GNAT family N-acetyltransferase [candidate division WOR-3 bacterium]|uniref:GNAT family N-acetyltransferase n=1 Tax=candidate division WOR-3 bacterium TaxID=2052148 RepID=A0A938BT62_UNCW3|nr:GNAT family N-acetyltransferase [candidate division WOR-3 bacterium]
MTRPGELRIGLFEPWMHNQVVDMISREYGVDWESQDRLTRAFYEHPYQRDSAIRIVALDDRKVVGFQSFFRWPYMLAGRMQNSYQSGNSIVHPDYRGQGIFRRLLTYMDVVRSTRSIDFVFGFPIEPSYGNLIRDGWSNTVDLNWLVLPLSPLSVLSRGTDLTRCTLGREREPTLCGPTWEGFILTQDPSFDSWRGGYMSRERRFFYHYAKGGRHARFDLKAKFRGRVKELVIGRPLTDCDDPAFVRGALDALVKKVRGERAFTILSIALNFKCREVGLLRILDQVGFMRIRKRIFFLVKDFTVGEALFNPELWKLYFDDIDTW